MVPWRMPAVAGMAVLSAACFAYQPLQQPVPVPGTEVRATLATPVSVPLGEVTVQNVNRIEGLVYRAGADSLVISGIWVYTCEGSRYAANGSALYFTHPELASLEVRRLSPGRSGLAGLVTVGLAASLFAGVKQALGGGGSPTPPTDKN
ncbi:MAG TPA: hypothetical protein VGJ80_14575 [Gemmatimonadales bacterium]